MDKRDSKYPMTPDECYPGNKERMDVSRKLFEDVHAKVQLYRNELFRAGYGSKEPDIYVLMNERHKYPILEFMETRGMFSMGAVIQNGLAMRFVISGARLVFSGEIPMEDIVITHKHDG